jgi:solute carrier family 30 (zinc transporter), member 2
MGKRITIFFSFSLYVLDEKTKPETVLREATTRIHAKYDFFETTLQIEVYEKEMEDCKDCTNPE